MRSNTFYQQHSVFINSALLAVHANQGTAGFRQKDVRFYIELLSNWVESAFEGPGIMVQNTQVQRILDQMVGEELLKKHLKQDRPYYSFTPIGLLEITTRLVSAAPSLSMEEFLFVYHIVSLYSQKMEELIISQKEFLPTSYQLEIRHLLNAKNIVEEKLKKIDLEIEKLQARIADAEKMSEYAEIQIRKGKTIDEIASELERKYPYQLNNQKKMSSLFKELSPDLKRIEVSEAPIFRARTLWTPMLEYYQAFKNTLSNLL